MKSNLLAVSVGLGSLAYAGLSSATSAYDISAVQTSLTDVGGQIILVGLAVLAVVIAIKAYKWIRRAL